MAKAGPGLAGKVEKIAEGMYSKELSNSIVNPTKESPVQGFERIKNENLTEQIDYSIKMDLTVLDMLRFGPKLLWYNRRISKGAKTSFKELRENQKFQSRKLNNELWKDLNGFCREKWEIVKIGFTRVPPELVFANHFILYPYALVCMMEMKKTKINKAPRAEAGVETIRVYAKLGEAVNDIARWLRKKGIRCQPNHPVGGFTVTPPLAGKAGMGWQGKMGLLITPEFGVRQRLAPIFLEKQVFEFTDSQEHKWIEHYCETCGICADNCPGEAILDKKIVKITNLEGIGALKTCINLPKCLNHFLLKFGCSVCVSVCPFSAGNGVYYKIKERFEN